MNGKPCSACNRWLPLDQYHRRNHYMRDGRRSECKTCTRERTKTSRAGRQTSQLVAQKQAVRKRTYRAIQNGDLLPQRCGMCGSLRASAHHRRYDGEGAHLDVDWLCRSCHAREHGVRAWTKQMAFSFFQEQA